MGARTPDMQVVTANRLTDGEVVYLADGAAWSESIGDGHVVRTQEEGERLMAEAEQAVAARLVVAPYLIEVANGDAGLRPVRYRELIRAQGPSVRLDLGKQATKG